MSIEGTEVRSNPQAAATLSFQAVSVTESEVHEVSDVQASLPAGAVAQAIAAQMHLPENTPWGLRDESTSVLLDDDKPIGEQIAPGARLKVTPKAHLGLG